MLQLSDIPSTTSKDIQPMEVQDVRGKTVYQKGDIEHNREREMFYSTTHSTHFIYSYMASDIWFKDHSDSEKGNPLPPHRLVLSINSKGSFICTISTDMITHTACLCYTSRGALAGMRNSSMGPPHEGSIRRPIASWANALPLSYVLLLEHKKQDSVSVSCVLVIGFMFNYNRSLSYN